MRIPLSWLKELIEIDQTPVEIAKTLTMAGLEVDGIETTSTGFKGIVVGLVTHTEPHPNADKLRIATVSDGTSTYQVVCGAANCRTGLKTAYAKIGSSLVDEKGEFLIKKATLRGIESFGMLCSEKELGFSDEHAGIIEFSSHLKEGTDVAELYADSIFEISLTPNLSHCSSVIGVARELAAATGKEVRYPEITLTESPTEISSLVKVKVEDEKKCPRYACRLIQNVKVTSSPDWLQKRLTSCGIRPINHVVDVTNYVLLEMGHPLHAFDYDRLEGHEVIVKCAKDKERLVTLDGKEHTLSLDDLLICDRSKGVAIAGVMGGANSEVSEKTQNVLLEAAYFSPATIRRTSKQLGIQTEASKRFERGIDPNILEKALDRACMLIQQISSADVVRGLIDVKTQNFPKKRISCRLSRINALLGTHLSLSEVENIFHRLNMTTAWDGVDTLNITVPTYRVDVYIEVDLIEEVARIYGYNNINRVTSHFSSSLLPNAPLFEFERDVRSKLISEGLQEFITCDLIGESSENIVQDSSMPSECIIRILNPTSIEQSILRPSLLPGLLQLVKYNYDHQNHDISGFEIGKIHFKENEQYKEQSVAGIILTGKSRPHDWNQKPLDVDYYDLKGILENILQEFGVVNFAFKENHLKTFHAGRQASIYVDALEIGSLGEVHPAIQRRLDIPQRIYFAEINLQDLIKVKKGCQKVTPLPIYPGSERDWTITLAEKILIHDALSAIQSIQSPLLEKIDLLDIYRSDKLGRDLKNVTLRFHYRDRSKTVAQETVDSEHERIVKESTLLLSKLPSHNF